MGNKSDLVDERAIDKLSAQSFADEHYISYFETSAFTGVGINEMMNDIMKKVYENKILPDKLNPPDEEEPNVR